MNELADFERAELETTHAPACPEAMREAARVFVGLRTRSAFVGGALFAQLDGIETEQPCK